MPRITFVLLTAACLLFHALSEATGEPPIDYGNLSDEAITNWGRSQHVFTAKLTGVAAGPVARSFPPIYNYRLTFQVTTLLRGSTPAGKPVTCFYSVRQKTPPKFPEGKECLVAAETSRGSLKAVRIEQTNAGNLNDARFASQLPIGWQIRDGKLISPWADLGTQAWPAAQRGMGFMTCSQTGRPVLLADEALQLTVKPVPPAKKVKYANPDGDGGYTVTLTNTGKKSITIDALRRQGKKILWEESMVILCQGKTYKLPQSRGITQPTEPTVLKPTESISTVIETFLLKGPEWPRGGYRLEFLFCLGQKSNLQSFYYLSKHHDPIRKGLHAKP